MSKETPLTDRASALLEALASKEDRTIADKIADSDRPSWEEFKKENKDLLEASEGKEMEAYRRELDADRERRMGGGRERKSRKQRKKRSKKKRRRAASSSSDSGSDGDDDKSSERRRRKHKKRKKKRSKKSEMSVDSQDNDGE